MSFILDALRKSEAARRRSETPDLFATLPQAPAPTRNRVAWPLWAMTGFGAVSSALALWLLLHRPEPPALTAPASTESASSASVAEAADTRIENDAAVDAPTTADVTAPPAPAAPAAATPPPPAPVQKPLPAPVAATTPAPVASAPPPTTVPAPPTAAPIPAPAPAPPPATNDRASALGDLDPDVRRQLPALKLSMQVWNEDPQRRFVILDGQRLREGDRVGEVVVERITRTEVLLSWRGARLRLPAE